MNCPKCNSANVAPANGKLLCQNCGNSFEAAQAPEPAYSSSTPHLIKCPACSREASSQAMRCPTCGQPLASAVIATAAITIVKRIVFGIVIGIVVIFIIHGFVKMALEQ